ncbi:MAG: hypothetical protein HYT11_03380 [Candidatus Levybacteria bacterium]|nr:hypothetical protein [Candidatus Levybacteria bacterium]
MFSEALSRRAFIRGSTAFSAAVTTGDVPDILEDVFTPDVEKGRGKRFFVAANDAVNDNQGRTAAVYSLRRYGSLVEKVDFIPTTEKYELRPNSAPVPIRIPEKAETIVGFANNGTSGNEKIIVGGYNEDESRRQYAAIAISSDSAETFEPFSLNGYDGQEVRGQVREIEKIPSTDIALLRISNQYDIGNQYGIYDAKSDEFRLIAAATDDLPLLDNLYVNPSDPAKVIGTGRIIRSWEYPRAQGIADFTLDLEDAVITSGSYRLSNYLIGLDDVFVLRDDQGEAQETFVLQTIRYQDSIYRLAHRIKQDDLESENYKIETGFEYGQGYDEMIRKSLKGLSKWHDEMTRYPITANLKNIHVFPQGHTWLTGEYQTITGNLPLAIYQNTGEEGALADEESVLPFFFPYLMTFPSSINQEPEFVKLWNGHQLPGIDEAVHGVLFNLEAGGGAMIETDENRVPLDEIVPWYQNPI